MAVIWIIEDNVAYRRATERALRGLSPAHEIRAFESCEDALAVLETSPDLILLDVGLPGMSGIEGLKKFRIKMPNVSILILTVFEEDEKIFNAICAGANGYLLKSESLQNVATAIEDTIAGGSPMNPWIAGRVLKMFSKLAPAKKDYGLTPREESVLKLMVGGLVKRQIADKLEQNAHTVDYMMRCIYKKLHVNCQAAAVLVAVKDGLVPPS